MKMITARACSVVEVANSSWFMVTSFLIDEFCAARIIRPIQEYSAGAGRVLIPIKWLVRHADFDQLRFSIFGCLQHCACQIDQYVDDDA